MIHSKIMERLKKIVRFILFGLLAYLIIFVLGLIIKGNLYGYKKSNDLFYPHKLEPLNDSIVKQISIESLYIDGRNDSIYLLQFRDEYQIILWNIAQYKNMTITNIGDNKKLQLEQENGEYYSKIIVAEQPLIEIKTKMKLPNEQRLSLCFNRNSFVKKNKRTKNYLYYYLKCNQIGFSSKPNYFDLIINKGSNSDVNFMVYTSKGKFYLVLMYSLRNKNLSSDMLYKIINVNDL